jgi:hypothetical protein
MFAILEHPRDLTRLEARRLRYERRLDRVNKTVGAKCIGGIDVRYGRVHAARVERAEKREEQEEEEKKRRRREKKGTKRRCDSSAFGHRLWLPVCF